MGNRSYSDDFKLRVVAIASVRGVPEAAKQFGVDARAVRIWVAERPDDDKLKLAADLALSELTLEIADGKRKGRLSVDAGILRDKVARYYRPDQRAEAPSDVETWGARIEAALDKAYGSDADLALMAAIEWMDGTEGDAPTIPDVMTYVTSLGDLHDWRTARDTASRQAVAAQLVANRAVAEATRRAAMDAETRAVLAEAERWLAANR